MPERDLDFLGRLVQGIVRNKTGGGEKTSWDRSHDGMVKKENVLI